MSHYVDGFVIAIPKKNLKAYKKMAQLACKIWKEYGALNYYECVGDDINVPWGVSFPKRYKLKPSETIIFAFIVYKSKVDRNKINKKIMKDPRMQMDESKMPFDMKQFSSGGFKTLVSSAKK